MEKGAVEDVGNWDKGKDVENGEKDRMCDKCYDARRGNFEIYSYCIRCCTRMYVVAHFISGIH